MVLGFKNSGLAGNPGFAPRSLNPDLSVVGCGGRSGRPTRQYAAGGALRARPVLALGPVEGTPAVRIPLIPPPGSWGGDSEVTRAVPWSVSEGCAHGALLPRIDAAVCCGCADGVLLPGKNCLRTPGGARVVTTITQIASVDKSRYTPGPNDRYHS